MIISNLVDFIIQILVIVREFLIMCIPDGIGFRIPSIDILLKFIVIIINMRMQSDSKVLDVVSYRSRPRRVFLEQIVPHPEK